MPAKPTLLVCLFVLAAACGRPDADAERTRAGANAGPRIVSLDYCADQFVLKLVDRENIAALSTDAEARFSYMRREAKGLPKARPRAEDILLLRPDIVVRTYGGGPNAALFFKRAGVRVVQIGFADDLDAVKKIVLDAARNLGVAQRGEALVAEMNARLSALPEKPEKKSILYLTSKGAVAGRHTLIDDLLQRAGYENFQSAPGWGTAPLERLAYEDPDMIAAGFFETSDLVSDIWSPARHPVARAKLAQTPVIELPGAWTACGAWFLTDAVEALSAGPKTKPNTP